MLTATDCQLQFWKSIKTWKAIKYYQNIKTNFKMSKFSEEKIFILSTRQIKMGYIRYFSSIF
jgi:hypothetical protein